MFRDRDDAGRQLAVLLRELRAEDPVVLGLPRGGVPVAAIVAEALDAPLDVIVVRKLGMPGHPEYAMGAIGEGGVRLLDEALVARLGIEPAAIAAVERRERRELDRRVAAVRAEHPAVDLAGRTALIVDDGLATGATARVACLAARARGASRIVVAVPCAPSDAARELPEADAFHAVILADDFGAVGRFYRDFAQVDDAEMLALLRTS